MYFHEDGENTMKNESQSFSICNALRTEMRNCVAVSVHKTGDKNFQTFDISIHL